jgi:hypothetical protein
MAVMGMNTVQIEQEMRMRSVIFRGLIAGAAGVAAMTVAEKVEQVFTHRPNSYVPAHTLARLIHLREPDTDRRWLNWLMHWGQGGLLGIVRAWLGDRGIDGPFGSFMFWNLRLAADQTLENATGAGRPPWTWPRSEQVIDIAHKGVYAFTTGAVTDALQLRKTGRNTSSAD